MIGARGIEPPTPCTPSRPGTRSGCRRISLKRPEMACLHEISDVSLGRNKSLMFSPSREGFVVVARPGKNPRDPTRLRLGSVNSTRSQRRARQKLATAP